MKLNDEINALIAKLDETLMNLTARWKAAETKADRRKWFALIGKGLDDRIDLMKMRG